MSEPTQGALQLLDPGAEFTGRPILEYLPPGSAAWCIALGRAAEPPAELAASIRKRFGPETPLRERA